MRRALLLKIMLACFCLASAALGCGYGPLNTMRDPSGPYALRLGLVRAISPEASVDMLQGARSVLAKAGMLSGEACDGEEPQSCALLVIDLLRIDEESAAPGWDESEKAVIARGIWVRVLGRARLYRRGEAQTLLRDTQDMAAGVLIARSGSDTNTRAESNTPNFAFSRSQALSAAARRLGERLALKILGLPSSGPDEISFAPDNLRASVSPP